MKVLVNNSTVNLVERVSFPEIIHEHFRTAFMEGLSEDPFYVCDLGEIVQKHNLWCCKLPRVEPFYAMKCNPTEIVVKLLAKLGVGFDCASKSEISHAIESGVPADRIIYANPCKQISHIKYAEANDVRMMTFDSTDELRKIYVHHPSALLVLRIFVGATKALCPLGLKFGAQITEVPQLIDFAQSLGLKVIGISFHVGSGCFDASAYRTAITLSHHAFKIAEAHGMPLSLLDIGGGFPGNLDTEDSVTFFDKVCDTINTCLETYFPESSGIRIIAEPGRYYVSSAFQLAATVTSIRATGVSEALSYSYYLNDGVYGSFNCTVFDHYIGEHYPLNDYIYGKSEEDTYSSVFWGPTCDSADKILEGFSVRKLNLGECIVFRNMGAYTMAAASSFNGFIPPYILYYSSKSNWDIMAPLLDSDSYVRKSCCTLNPMNDIMPAIDECKCNGFGSGVPLACLDFAS